MRSHLDFVAETGRESGFVSAIFSIPGFVLSYVLPDFMHTVCPGSDSILGGQCNVGAAPGTWRNARIVQRRLLATAQNDRHRCPRAWPGRAIRATDADNDQTGHNFLPIMTCVVENFFPPRTERDVLRLQCCKALCRVYLELRTSREGSPARLELATRQHLILHK